MMIPDLGIDLVTVLRVATMLVFIAVFLGIVLRLFRPGAGNRAEAQARAALFDDDDLPPERHR